ncbi:MAG: hypothetical protein WBV82_24665 [Myxococcaceae bacterium]
MAWKQKRRAEPTHHEQSKTRPVYTRGEMPVLVDGQLGGANLERGPERANPEGTVDTANGDYWAVEYPETGGRRWAAIAKKE